MLVQVYHGSNNFDPRPGYKGGKPNSYQYGIGLYCTNSYTWAANYGRRQYLLTLDLDDSKAAHNVEIAICTLQSWVNAFCTKKLATLFKKEFQYRDTMSVERFEIFLLWNIKSMNKLAMPLANFFAHNGCTHSIESGSYGGRLVRLFDFDCIKASAYDKATLKAAGYADTAIPNEIDRYKKVLTE